MYFFILILSYLASSAYNNPLLIFYVSHCCYCYFYCFISFVIFFLYFFSHVRISAGKFAHKRKQTRIHTRQTYLTPYYHSQSHALFAASASNVYQLGNFSAHNSGFLYSLSNCTFSTVTNFKVDFYVKGILATHTPHTNAHTTLDFFTR